MSLIKYRIKDLSGFKSAVFGADCFLKNFPEIQTTGVELQRDKNDDWYYVMEDGQRVNDTTFFTREEMEYMERVKKIPVKKLKS